MLANIAEVKARQGRLGVGNGDDSDLRAIVDYLLPVANALILLTPASRHLPLQRCLWSSPSVMLISQNLAKSVTVE